MISARKKKQATTARRKEQHVRPPARSNTKADQQPNERTRTVIGEDGEPANRMSNAVCPPQTENTLGDLVPPDMRPSMATVNTATNCPFCGSTKRSHYSGVSLRPIQGELDNGTEFNCVILRHCKCIDCGRKRVERSFERLDEPFHSQATLSIPLEPLFEPFASVPRIFELQNHLRHPRCSEIHAAKGLLRAARLFLELTAGMASTEIEQNSIAFGFFDAYPTFAVAIEKWLNLLGIAAEDHWPDSQGLGQLTDWRIGFTEEKVDELLQTAKLIREAKHGFRIEVVASIYVKTFLSIAFSAAVNVLLATARSRRIDGRPLHKSASLCKALDWAMIGRRLPDQWQFVWPESVLSPECTDLLSEAQRGIIAEGQATQAEMLMAINIAGSPEPPPGQTTSNLKKTSSKTAAPTREQFRKVRAAIKQCGQTADPKRIAREIDMSNQTLRRILRELESQGNYCGFARRPPQRHA